jgi:hypothetical protein
MLTTTIEKQMLLTLSQNMCALKFASNTMMLLAQDSIEEFMFASIQRLKATHMVKIQNLKDMHGQKMDILQNQISRLITNL